MDSKYFITVELENGQYIGKVFLASTNQLTYTTKSYNTREQAMTDARTYVITSAPPTTDPQPPKAVTSTASYTGTPPTIHGYSRNVGSGRCCGR